MPGYQPKGNRFTAFRMIENCGMPDEHIYHCIDEIPDQASYYSIIVVKEEPHD